MTRIEQNRGEPVTRGDEFTFRWNGRDVIAYPGETILGALIASGVHAVRHTERFKEPRGMLCGMGVCFDCLVAINGVAGFRACVTPAQPGIEIAPHELPLGL